MNRPALKFLTASMLIVFGFFLLPTAKTLAAISSWPVKGVSMSPRWNTDFSSDTFKQSVRNAAATHVNNITLIIPLYQSNVNSTDVHTGGNTPTDQSLADGINFIHSLGIQVTLKFHDFPDDGQWSALINPADRNSWFANYGNLLRHYTSIAAQNKVEWIVVGNEFIDMVDPAQNSTNTQNWVSLISSVRAIYGGKLTYGANWGDPGTWADEKNHIQFWSSLDAIGISAYYNLSDDLQSSWQNYLNTDIQPLQAKWGKPIIFTELGYRSAPNTHRTPWNWWGGGPVDLQEQANDYDNLFSFWNNVGFFQGVSIWQWSTDPNAGGAGNNDYTPQGKPAQDIMTKWYGGSGTPVGGGGGGTPSFTSSSSVSAQPQAGQAATITVSLQDTAAAVSGAIVDTEVYAADGTRSLQKFFENQSFATGASQNYNVSWTPPASGSFVLRVGVFNGSWSTNYYWNNNALAINVAAAGGGGGGTPPAGSINVWWPTDGSTISGVQPFKAMLTNSDVSNYAMFWQVDSGGLNTMDNSATDFPHKEALVDVSGWNWRAAGPYKINFVAKDLAGQLITQQLINIMVAH